MRTTVPPPTICECPDAKLVWHMSFPGPFIACLNCKTTSAEKKDLEQLVASTLGPRFVRSK
jgi:hypothetical protein